MTGVTFPAAINSRRMIRSSLLSFARTATIFRLDNREAALKGGENNQDDIVPGDSAKSKLIHYVARLVEDLEMPPPGKGEPLTPEQIGVLRAWIDQGAKWSPGSETALRETKFSITPTAQWITVSGNARKFRETQHLHLPSRTRASRHSKSARHARRGITI